MFSQIGVGQSDARIAAHINRVLRSLYEFDVGSSLTKGLQSHSARRGGAAHASSHGEVKLSDLAHRGMWSMDGFATLLEYISPTSSSDQRIAKVLSGWRDPSQAGVPPTIAGCETPEQQEALDQFAQHIRHVYFPRLQQRGFADCLTASLLMYLDDTLEAKTEHLIHEQLFKAAVLTGVTRGELQSWGRTIRKRFILDNLTALPVHVIKQNLAEEELVERHVGVHTFADSLERCVVGYREMTRQMHDFMVLLSRVLEQQTQLLSIMQSGSPQTAMAVGTLATQRVQQQTSQQQPAGPLMLGRPWPSDFVSLSGVKVQDLIVRYIMDDLATVQFSLSNRMHREVRDAIAIVKKFADLSSVPRRELAINAEGDVVRYANSVAAFARVTQARVVDFIDQHRQRPISSSALKRKRSLTGSVAGVVKAWGEVPDIHQSFHESSVRVQFEDIGPS